MAGTQVVRIQWQPNEGGVITFATNCRIPNTPASVDYLLTKILFIDPKTMRGSGGSLPIPMGPLAPAMDAAQPIGGVNIVATLYPNGWAGSSSTRSNPDQQSISPWDGGVGNWDPGNPCGTGQPYATPAESFMGATDAEACPNTLFASICIDVYIAQCSVMGLEGDCRGADPAAPASASRAQIVIPLRLQDTAYATTTVHETCLKGQMYCHPALHYPDNAVSISYVGNDTIAVRIKLTNSVTTWGGTVPSPAIDASMIFVRGSDGRFTHSAGTRDAFPSVSIYETTDGQRRTLLQLDETNITALIGWTKQVQAWCF